MVMTRGWWMTFQWSAAMVMMAALAGAPAAAQTAEAGCEAPTGNAEQEEADPDLDPNPAQPDFTVVNLPTTLRLPRHKSAFRVTHRFARPLGAGTFGSLLEDFFGLDAGAQIGLEYRFGLFRGTQIGIHRTSDRTIEFFGQHDVRPQTEGRAFGLAVVAAVEGTNNFRDARSPAVGVNASMALREFGAVYVIPVWVGNTNLLTEDPLVDDYALLLGLGARLRIRPTVYLVGEYIPRVAGYDARVNQASVGIEKRAGGHSFQLNFNNGFGTTWGQMARGGTGNEDWYIGFNISRKFF